MLIKNIKVSNYKTYQSLDLDLNVEPERPIILIGGKNGGGKTTLFEAIYGALYGLDKMDAKRFHLLLNMGKKQSADSEIVLQLTFSGRVLGREQQYILCRTYRLLQNGKVGENVRLNMNGNVFAYGPATPPAERAKMQQVVQKIIKANLPQELSRYFLFDAMEAGNLLKEDQLNHVIKENIENVMGFNKYLQLSRVCEHLQQEYAEKKLKQENEQKEYRALVDDTEEKKHQLEALKSNLDKCLLYSANNSQMYNMLKNGKQEEETLRNKIRVTQQKIAEVEDRSRQYLKDLEALVESLEVNVFLPHLLKLRQAEVSLVLKNKTEMANSQKQQVDEPMVRDLTHQIVSLLQEDCPFLMGVDEDKIVGKVMKQQVQPATATDNYAYLDNEEVEALRSLVSRKTFNSVPQLAMTHAQINLEIDNLPTLKSDIELMQQQISGNDYALLKAYEDNEAEIARLNEAIKAQEDQISKQQYKISQFDIQIQQEPDPKYDTLVEMKPFFDDVANTLLRLKKTQIEAKMREYLNQNLAAYRGVIGRVELSEQLQDLTFKIYHKAGNEIALSTLNAGAKQVVIQVLLKVLHELGDYDPPVMIDTVMGVLDKDSRTTIMENYFPSLAEQTILLSTDTEIRTSEDYERLEPFIAKTYTLERNREEQCTTIEQGYFGIMLNQ